MPTDGTYRTIAEYLDWAQQTVRETIKRWQYQGLGGLWEKPGRGKNSGILPFFCPKKTTHLHILKLSANFN
ncbi:transposase [Calothrix sp. NIES-2100]|nr:transposase [Calothrix sp. NIES-2100]